VHGGDVIGHDLDAHAVRPPADEVAPRPSACTVPVGLHRAVAAPASDRFAPAESATGPTSSDRGVAELNPHAWHPLATTSLTPRRSRRWASVGGGPRWPRTADRRCKRGRRRAEADERRKLSDLNIGDGQTGGGGVKTGRPGLCALIGLSGGQW
jgi:hypothetical protein